MKELNTQRILLRPILEQDIDEIYAYAKEENVGPNAGWKPHANREETSKIAKEIFIAKENIWGIIVKEEDTLIGTIGLIDDPKRENDQVKMLGYAMSQKYWGKGIMTETAKEVIRYGFEELNLTMISVYCYSFNERSRRVIEKCGFEYEGMLKKAVKSYEGKIYDEQCYAIDVAKFEQEIRR